MNQLKSQFCLYLETEGVYNKMLISAFVTIVKKTKYSMTILEIVKLKFNKYKKMMFPIQIFFFWLNCSFNHL